jgi:hypothetical protein
MCLLMEQVAYYSVDEMSRDEWRPFLVSGIWVSTVLESGRSRIQKS